MLLLVAAELVYFRIADKCNIIDKPNERSSHSTIVLRGGGIIFAISIVVWFLWQLFQDPSFRFQEYLPFLCGLLLIAWVSFWDDVHSLPDSVRLVAQFTAMALMFWSMGIMHWDMWWFVIIALIVCVGATNVINFMDGINGITAGYSLAVLIPLALVNGEIAGQARNEAAGFIEQSYLVVAILGVLVFSFFNLTIVFLLRTSAMLKRAWHCTRFGVGSGPRARRNALPVTWEAWVPRSSSSLRWEN